MSSPYQRTLPLSTATKTGGPRLRTTVGAEKTTLLPATCGNGGEGGGEGGGEDRRGRWR